MCGVCKENKETKLRTDEDILSKVKIARLFFHSESQIFPVKNVLRGIRFILQVFMFIEISSIQRVIRFRDGTLVIMVSPKILMLSDGQKIMIFALLVSRLTVNQSRKLFIYSTSGFHSM